MDTRRILVVLGLIFIAIGSRFFPHPPNFNAMNAIALFSAFTFRSHTLTLFVVFAGMFLSDLVLGMHSQMLFVYGSLALTALLGHSSLRLYFTIPGSSLLFFIVVNFGVWLKDGMYPQTFSGLGLCYVAALPFYTNQLLGDLFFNAALFGIFYGSTLFFNNKDMRFSSEVEKENNCRT